VASVGFLMLYSVAGGSFSPWAEPQMKRFAMGFAVMFVVAMVPIWFWRNMSGLAYLVAILLLLFAVEFFGAVRHGRAALDRPGLHAAAALGGDEDHAGDGAGGLLRLAAARQASRARSGCWCRWR
jgi:hypothetical protein